MNLNDLLPFLPPDIRRTVRQVQAGIGLVNNLVNPQQAPPSLRGRRARRVKAPAQPLPRAEPQASNPPAIDAEKLVSAAGFLSLHSGIPATAIVAEQVERENALRIARRKLHPDNQATGNADAFREVQSAYETLCQMVPLKK
jgi:hypothetical protein